MGDISPDTRREMITKKAYELYVKGGCKPGNELEDWLKAEKLVDREIQDMNKKTESSGPRPVTSPPPTPIRSSPSKVSGYKRVTG